MPLARDQLEAVGLSQRFGALGRLAVGAGVDAISQPPPGLVAALAGFTQTHLGVRAKGKHLFLTPKPVLEPPPLAAAGGNPQQQAVSVIQLDGLLAWLGVLDGSVGEWHLGVTILGVTSYPESYPQNARAVKKCPGTVWDAKSRETKEKARIYRAFGMSRINLKLVFGGAGGNRTRVRKPSTESSTYLVLSFDLTGASRTDTLYNGESLNFRP